MAVALVEVVVSEPGLVRDMAVAVVIMVEVLVTEWLTLYEADGMDRRMVLILLLILWSLQRRSVCLGPRQMP